MTNLLAAIEVLEKKQENGTITMDEETMYIELYEKVNSILFK